MAERQVVVEKEVASPVVVSDGDGGESAGSNAIWALALILIVGMIVGAVYYSGILRKVQNPAQKVNVEVKAP